VAYIKKLSWARLDTSNRLQGLAGLFTASDNNLQGFRPMRGLNLSHLNFQLTTRATGVSFQ